ncbi:hypothetical protein AB1Y20_013946 [Prymnesium parvum]|uniref:RING-type domain-containing protein n=1 Tax=Prymnesium parvum TaxID=97485 RepID=A0AB34IEF3_PRYPA
MGRRSSATSPQKSNRSRFPRRHLSEDLDVRKVLKTAAAWEAVGRPPLLDLRSGRTSSLDPEVEAKLRDAATLLNAYAEEEAIHASRVPFRTASLWPAPAAAPAAAPPRPAAPVAQSLTLVAPPPRLLLQTRVPRLPGEGAVVARALDCGAAAIASPPSHAATSEAAEPAAARSRARESASPRSRGGGGVLDRAVDAMRAQQQARFDLASMVRESAGQRVARTESLLAAAPLSSSSRLIELEAAISEAREIVANGERQLDAIRELQEARLRSSMKRTAVEGDTANGAAPSSEGALSARIRSVRTAAEEEMVRSRREAEREAAERRRAIDEHLATALAESVAERAVAVERAAVLERAASLERSLLASRPASRAMARQLYLRQPTCASTQWQRLRSVSAHSGARHAAAAEGAARPRTNGRVAREADRTSRSAAERLRRLMEPLGSNVRGGSGVSEAAEATAARPAAARRKTILPASAAEMNEAKTRWAVRLDLEELHQRTDGDSECAICLGDMEAKEELVCLPCSNEKAKSHIFHSDCLARWLLTSAVCPTCRRGVRPMLTRARECAHR